MAQCPACKQDELEERDTELWMRRHDGTWALLKDVPALVCDLCGETILREDVSQELAQILASNSGVAENGELKFPVYDFRHAQRLRRRQADLNAIPLQNPLREIFSATLPLTTLYGEETELEVRRASSEVTRVGA